MKFRLFQLGVWIPDPRPLEDHQEECESCQDWLYNLKNDVLDSGDGYFVHIAYVKDFPDYETFLKVIKQCRYHGVEAKPICKNEKLGRITLVCNTNEFKEK